MKTLISILLAAVSLTSFGTNKSPSSVTTKIPPASASGATMQQMMKLYGELTKRTVLIHPSALQLKLTLPPGTNQADTIQLIESALAEQQFVVVPDGEKFVMIAGKDHDSGLVPKSSAIPKQGTTTSNAQMFPKGSIHYQAAHTSQVLPIYAEILGKKLDRSAPLPRGTPSYIFLITTTALTKEEIIYAMDTLLEWHGIKVIPAGDGFVKAVSTSELKSNPTTK